MTMPPSSPLRAVTLTLTERCNLRCGYCYVPRERARSMSAATAERAVDLLLQHATGPKASLFFFGGEPWLERGLLRDCVDRARRGTRPGQALELGVTTNGTRLDDEALELCRTHRIRLALSLDGVGRRSERLDANGEDSTGAVLERLDALLALEPDAELTVRMTVTPSNVAGLAATVQGLGRLGVKRIVFLPALELGWDHDAVALFAREHRRLGIWLRGLRAAGGRPPRLPSLQGIENRLLRGKARTACGAGTRNVAVDAVGNILPCYRLVFARENEACRLGHLETGFSGTEAAALFAALQTTAPRPEQGDCASCSARAGCTFFCPAIGFVLTGDPSRVPAAACALMRAQVDAVREMLAPPPARRRAVARAAWAGAAVLATLAVPPVAASCASEVDVETYGGGDGAGGAGGVCPIAVDAGDDASVGGVCPVEIDAGDDASVGGVCPVEIDAGEDAGPGGVCPVEIDAGDDAGPGGLCPVEMDASEDAYPPGLC